MDDKTECKLPVSAINKATQLFSQMKIAEQQLHAFLDGCKEGMGLDGDWNLDIATWTFTKLENESTKPKEGVQ